VQARGERPHSYKENHGSAIMGTAYPRVFARFYDVIYDRMRSASDHDYLMKKIMASKGPVLEVGVGTGRFFTTSQAQKY